MTLNYGATSPKTAPRVSRSSSPRLREDALDPERRAIQTSGRSNGAIYRAVAQALRSQHKARGIILDVGCGGGALRAVVTTMFDRYVGTDVVRYDWFPADCEFHKANLDQGLPLPESFADAVVAVEIIEHLENPRALMRELVRVAKPGGTVVVTTPNQLSFLSLLTLITKHRFREFQDVHYPAHMTALLEVDLMRMAFEMGLLDIGVRHSGEGRIPWTLSHFPHAISRTFPRALSDNVLLIGKKPICSS